MIGPRTFLEYQNYRYLKVALSTLFLSIVVYVVDDPPGGPGVVVLGLATALGTIAAGDDLLADVARNSQAELLRDGRVA